MGLRRDGTGVVQSHKGSQKRWWSADDWIGITAVACGYKHIAGLREDGTVEPIGGDRNDRQYVRGWKDIVSIGCTWDATFGLKRDGTVESTADRSPILYRRYHTEKWKDIVSIDCCDNGIVGLKRNGTVVVSGSYGYLEEQVSDWQDIISVACGLGFIAGLRHDGTVAIITKDYNDKIREAQKWKNVVSIVAGDCILVGIVGPENGPGVVRPLVEAASDMLQKTSQQDVMETAYVISTDCISCGSCADICPMDAISADDLQYNIDVGMCVECGACADVCPVNAIFVWKL